jgi:hypothetical protein
MSLLSQFDDWLKEALGDLKLALRDDAKKLVYRGIDIFRGYVPIDTERLKQTIKGDIFENEKGYELRIWVENLDIPYDKKSINAISLGMLLERGRGRKNVRLLRTRSNEFAAGRTPTEAWFQKASEQWVKECIEYLGVNVE